MFLLACLLQLRSQITKTLFFFYYFCKLVSLLPSLFPVLFWLVGLPSILNDQATSFVTALKVFEEMFIGILFRLVLSFNVIKSNLNVDFMIL